MHHRLIHPLVGTLAAGVALLLTGDARAGYTIVQPPSCYSYAGIGGSCAGTIAGFRNDSDPGASVAFEQYAYGSTTAQSFSAVLNGSGFSCVVTSASPAIQAMWPQSLRFDDYFYVSWDTTGACTSVFFLNTSYE